ncbi:thymidylate synthase [Virgisporangium aliadipatigenens]|uniref:Thymidylate synthase n=1 Tax=Virgisporangium aliadipatigenens TaxID=741659 RepID=A0A8J4DVE4_9ACTN|nr:thymidylate synthase [Virgisporangium aliadipatigenens]GIJ52315.1 thymidylate synthase [Virgisporangium aliadipatigenens]
MHSFDDFHAAYLSILQDAYKDYDYVNKPRGNLSREKLGVSFVVRDPIQRQVMSAARRANIVFNFAEALWYLSGSDLLEPIAHYAPSIRQYSADGVTLPGTAYGPRIMSVDETGTTQWANVVAELRRDPDSKRAILQIFRNDEIGIPGNIDVACTLALQFLVREGRLEAIGFMRANDAYRGLVSDYFSFTFIQEVLARELGVEVGAYHHHVGSLHIYEDDWPRAERVLSEPAPAASVPRDRFPVMPAGDNWPHIHRVLALEAVLRRNEATRADLGEALADLPEYWADVVALFELQRQVTFEGRIRAESVSGLPPVYRWLVEQKWAARIVS